MTLLSLRRNETAIITHCSIKKLCDLGLVPGIEIRMIKTGSPCIVGVLGTNFGIGRGHQVRIKIERKESDGDCNGRCKR